MNELPATVAALIEGLDRVYPHECIRKGESVEDAHRRAGERAVVDFLKALQRKADEGKDGLPSVRLR